ncbi:MAG: hypothetical protein CMP59_01620 [Flavobacteriales bacterium]|nr:hypothetical protein [Flavobacteriales bacterium]|tara:strand:+ start:170 stop:2356 length:2187 start_codon:yes stop_codon:yes gene_type:complete
MKKVLLSVFGICLSALLGAQTYPYVDVNQIGFVSQMDLQNCNDSSQYLGDTVVTRGVVIVDGNLSEVASSSVQGGSRPFISIVDTAWNGISGGPFESIIVMGVVNSTNIPVSDIENAVAGDILEMTVEVSEFNGLIQLAPISSTSVQLVGQTNAPTFRTISAGDIQDNQRNNVLPTGEQWEGAYVELQNMTVTNVSIFSSGSRCEFTVADANGNQVLVADRYLPMVVNNIPTVNPNSPDSFGTLVPPSVNTVYNHIRGLIFQDENGCQGVSQFAGGYEINPFDSTDFDKAASPANVSNVRRNPSVPNASQTVTVTADIIDNDGVVTGATLYYSADTSTALNLFQSVAMTNTTGIEYSGTIPAFPLDSIVRYYIEATDDSSNVTTSSVEYYTVRANGATIMDIQYTLPGTPTTSSLEGDTVTVTGIVTASYQAGDLGYLYIQDPSATQYAGIFVEGGPTAVFGFNRGDEVTITGVVAEQFGFTKIQATNAVATSNTGTITPVVLDPSDATYFGSNGASTNAVEPYESMLVRFENPMMAGQVWVINPDRGFGEYTVGSGQSATNSARVLAGRQSGTSAQSSLDVSYISDTAAYGSGLNVTPIQVNTATSMDYLEGMMYFSFSNFKLTPRNNADFGNILVSLAEQQAKAQEYELSMYPNPAQDRVYLEVDENLDFDILDVEVFDLQGRRVIYSQSSVRRMSLNLAGLDKGVYLVKVTTRGEVVNNSKLVIE